MGFCFFVVHEWLSSGSVRLSIAVENDIFVFRSNIPAEGGLWPHRRARIIKPHSQYVLSKSTKYVYISTAALPVSN